LSIKNKKSCRLFHIDLYLDKSFQSVNIDGMICFLGEFERLIATKSSCLKTHNSKDDHDLFIKDANTHEEYKDNSNFVPGYTRVIVARQIRGRVDTRTSSTNQLSVVSSNDIIECVRFIGYS
jgi:hypothetical protein